MQFLRNFPMPDGLDTGHRQSKRHYSDKIRNHMKQIRDEIVHLTRISSAVKTSSVSLVNDRKIARDRARIYNQEEKKLNVYNLALEFFMTRKTETEIKDNISLVVERNNNLSTELDTLFIYKSQNDETRNELLAETEQIKQAEEYVINNLPYEQAVEYKTLLYTNNNHLQVISKLKRKIDETKQALSALEQIQSFTVAKQARRKLLQELNQRQREKKRLQQALQEMKVELCLQTIKNDKKDVEALEKAKVMLEEQREVKEKELEEMVNVIDSGKNETLEKYAKREKQVNEYLDIFDERVAEVRQKINQEERRIESALDCVLSKINNVEALDEGGDLRSQYKSLTLQIRKLEMEKEQKTNELVSFQDKISEMKSDSESFQNLESKLNELTYDIQVLEENQHALRTTLAKLVTEAEDAKERLNHVTFLLNENEAYGEFCRSSKELEKWELQNDELINLIENCEKEGECNLIRDDIDVLLAKCNERLIRKLSKKD